MKLIITGCEYSGTTTLAKGVCRWAESVMGGRFEFHDHWKIPNIACYPGVAAPSALTEAEQQEILALSPKFKEMLQRQSIIMHLPTGDQGPDYIMVGFHIEDTVYAPLYFDYGGPDEPQGGPRTGYARHLEELIVRFAPDTVLVLVKAAPEVISRRMKESPHQNGVLREDDVELVLQRFEEEDKSSLIENRITLDTTDTTPEETVSELVEKLDPFLTEADRVRMLTHQVIHRRA